MGKKGSRRGGEGKIGRRKGGGKVRTENRGGGGRVIRHMTVAGVLAPEL
jgi:hypothetical protein